MPENVDLESDTDENAALHQVEFEAVAVRLAALEPTLAEWCRRELPGLLPEPVA